MTQAEAKVKELTDKLLDVLENGEGNPKDTLNKVRGYLTGLSDGLAFSEEMNTGKKEA